MKKNSSLDHRIPFVSECEDFFNQPIDLLSRQRESPYSDEYKTFLKNKIWGDASFTIDDMIAGKDITNPNQMAPCAFTTLRKKLYECLEQNNSLVIQLVEDCGHRLDELESETGKHIKEDTLTGSEYIKVKRSSNVIRVVFLIISSRLEREESADNKNSINHPLKSQTKSNLRKIMLMTSKVDQHLDSMLESVNKENLRADNSAWLAGAAVVFFAILYINSFFALDEENSAADQAAYFFGFR